MVHDSELSSNRTRVVVHGLLTIAALFIGAGAIVLMRGDDAVTSTQTEQVVAPIVAPMATEVAPKTLPPITLPNIDDSKPTKAIATR